LQRFHLNIKNISLRPVRDEDIETIYKIYCSTAIEKLSLMHKLPDLQKENFLKHQFRLQHNHYINNYTNVYLGILENPDSVVGRLYIEEKNDELCIVDITLLPSFRSQGLGKEILKNILLYARSGSKKVILHVENANKAIRLYMKLGFCVVKDYGVYSLMEYK